MEQFDETELRRFWDVEKSNGMLTEIRLISPEGKIVSGYFKSIDNLINELRKFPGYGVYYTINSIKEDCYGRIQSEKFVVKPKNTTVDNDILYREEVVLDLDPVRCAGTNSTEEELAYAKQKTNDIYKFLRDNGFYAPIICLSPNGTHIKLRCAMQNNDKNTQLVKQFLLAMDMLFSDDKVEVDTSLSNAARILKCCGTMSLKGNDNPNSDRPRRLARYVKVPEDWYSNYNTNEYFQKVADMLPSPEKPSYSNNYTPNKFNLEEFMKEHNIVVTKVVRTAKHTKYVLKECAFGGTAHENDSAVFAMADGSYGWYCFHSSCQNFSFKDWRLHYDPESYSRRDYAEYQQKRKYYGVAPTQIEIIPENEKDGAKWLSPKDIKYVDLSETQSIPFGYEKLDSKLTGMLLGDVTVLSGSSGAGKTSWLDCVALNVIQRGYKVAIWSGEFQSTRFMSWMDVVAAGKSYTRKKDGYENFYYCPQNIATKVNEWLDGKLFLYNNNYKNKAHQLLADIRNVIEQKDVNLICLDNLAAMSLTEYQGAKYDQQTQLITDIKDLAKEKNVSIILVCHPRKASTYLRKEDISGTADLVNLCDNLLILHRVGKDFRERAKDFIPATELKDLEQYSTIIEVCKNRQLGVVDYNVGMYFEPESRRLKNSLAEHIVYGWADEPVQTTLTEIAPPPVREELLGDIPFVATDEPVPF